MLRSLPCAHKFHDSCILAWLKRNTTCPLCKYVVYKRKEQKSDGGDSSPRDERQQRRSTTTGGNVVHPSDEQLYSVRPGAVPLNDSTPALSLSDNESSDLITATPMSPV